MTLSVEDKKIYLNLQKAKIKPEELIRIKSCNCCLSDKDTSNLLKDSVSYIVGNYKEIYYSCLTCKKNICNLEDL